MNGSTNGVVGFNLEEAKDAATCIDCSYDQLRTSILFSAMLNLSKLLFNGKIQIDDLTETEKYGWYAPEAIEFEKNVFLPCYENLSKSIYNIYITPFNKIVEATKRWCQTTGIVYSNISDHIGEGSLTNGYSIYHRNDLQNAKATDENGNIRISPDLPNLIIKEKNRFFSKDYLDLHENLIRLLSHTGSAAFLGASQGSLLIAMVEGMCRRVEKEVAGLYDTAAREVQKSVDKYRALAQQVAGSFNN